MPTNGKIVLSESGFYLNGKKCEPGRYVLEKESKCKMVVTVRNEGNPGWLKVEIWYKVNDKPWSERSISEYWLGTGSKTTDTTKTILREGRTYQFKWIVRDSKTGRVTDEYGIWVVVVKSKPKPNGKIVRDLSYFEIAGKKCKPGEYTVVKDTPFAVVLTVKNVGEDGYLRMEVWAKARNDATGKESDWFKWIGWRQFFEAGDIRYFRIPSRFIYDTVTYWFKFVVRREDGTVTDEYGC